jgi:hypothetical protein
MIYLSTYNTDLILVSEEKHNEAFSHLSTAVKSPSKSTEVPSSSTLLGNETFLTVLPDRLAIATFKSNDIRSSCHSLVEQFFFHSKYIFSMSCVNHQRPNRFFSFTSSATETSLILDYDTISAFDKDVLEVHGSSWRALEVSSTAASKLSLFSYTH